MASSASSRCSKNYTEVTLDNLEDIAKELQSLADQLAEKETALIEAGKALKLREHAYRSSQKEKHHLKGKVKKQEEELASLRQKYAASLQWQQNVLNVMYERFKGLDEFTRDCLAKTTAMIEKQE